jgi:TRAP-type mannitol/chloroaromatic compound transport system permease small subunit
MIRLIDPVIALLEAITRVFGRVVSWLVLYMVVVTFANVVLRYMYGISDAKLVESVLYAFAVVFAATAGYALLHNEHVRIDVFYGRLSARGRALVDLFGTLFLLCPLLWIVWTTGVPFVERAWRQREGSADLAGIPYLYILKTVILVFVVTLGIQALAFALRALRTVLGGAREAPQADRRA